MKSDNQAQSSKQRLVTFLNNVCPQKIAENDNDNPIEKSRWAKWQFIKSGTGNKLEFHQLKKSESKIINRLLDRLDPSAGKARHAARIEIIKLLENNGIVITDNIKKHLPDSRKLGDINALGKSIQNAMSEKNLQLSKNIEEFKDLIRKHAAETALSNEPTHLLRNSGDAVYKKAGQFFSLEFKSILIDFSENILAELSLMKPPVSEEKFIQLMNEKFKNLYEKIKGEETWKLIRNGASDSINSALNELGNEITNDQKIVLQGKFDELLDGALMFASISNLSSSIMAGYQEDFKNIIKRLVDFGNNKNKANGILLTNIVGGFTLFLKNKAIKK